VAGVSATSRVRARRVFLAMLCRALLRRSSAAPPREYREEGPRRRDTPLPNPHGVGVGVRPLRGARGSWRPGLWCPARLRPVCLLVGRSSPPPLQHLLGSYQCSREDDHLSHGETGMPVPPFGCAFSAGKAGFERPFSGPGCGHHCQLAFSYFFFLFHMSHALVSEFLVLKRAGNSVLAARRGINRVVVLLDTLVESIPLKKRLQSVYFSVSLLQHCVFQGMSSW